MRLSRTRQSIDWPVSASGTITYRQAESLDVDIAHALATGWAGKMIANEAADLLTDFGWVPDGEADLLQAVADQSDDFKAFANHLFAVALGLRLISALTGCVEIIDPDDSAKDRPLSITRADLSLLFRDPETQSTWLEKAQKPLWDRRQAGNGSST